MGAISCAQNLTASVRPYVGNSYQLIYHPWDKMLDEYGRGTERVRDDVRRAPKEGIRSIWDNAHAEAALHYLEAKSLIPAECKNGVVIGVSRQYEGGSGSTVFTCK